MKGRVLKVLCWFSLFVAGVLAMIWLFNNRPVLGFALTFAILAVIFTEFAQEALKYIKGGSDEQSI